MFWLPTVPLLYRLYLPHLVYRLYLLSRPQSELLLNPLVELPMLTLLPTSFLVLTRLQLFVHLLYSFVRVISLLYVPVVPVCLLYIVVCLVSI